MALVSAVAGDRVASEKTSSAQIRTSDQLEGIPKDLALIITRVIIDRITIITLLSRIDDTIATQVFRIRTRGI